MAIHEITFDQDFYADENTDSDAIELVYTLTPKKVIFNDPATIVYWRNGSKTVVKCSNGDVYDREKGFAMCVLKQLYSNKFYTRLKKRIQQEENDSMPVADESSNVTKIKRLDFELIFEYYEDAKAVRFALIDLIKNYGFASVSDLYDLINRSSTYEDTKRGWYNLTRATITPTRDGYVLSLPGYQFKRN